MADSQALPFRIRVLDGPLSTAVLIAGQPAGSVALVGWSLPFRPISYGQTMRSKTTFYPGNPEGTQQLIGKTFKPMTVSGVWNDVNLGAGAARALVGIFEQILDSGSSLEVSWGEGVSPDGLGTMGQAFVRVGILSDFDFDPERPQDIAWKATFDWRGRGEAFSPAVSPADIQNPREGFQEAVGALVQGGAATRASFDQIGNLIPQSVRDKIDRALTDIASATDQIQSVTSLVTVTASYPASAARALLGACGLAIDAATQLEAQVLAVDPTRLLLSLDDGVPLLMAKIRTFFLLDQADGIRDAASRSSDGVEGQVEPEVIAEVRAPAGVDLRDLALRYYGDPDSWWAIANFNDIEGSAVPDPPTGAADHLGLPIRIPRLGGGPQSDIRQNC